MSFLKYLVYAGLNLSKAKRLSKHIKSWDDLYHCLDQHSLKIKEPLPQRTSIPTPVIETSWKAALYRRFFSMKQQGQPVGHIPSWPEAVEKRRKISLIITIIITFILIIISNNTLSYQHINPILKNLYLILYGIMSYFMISTFSKLIIGSWHALRGAKGNPWHPAHTATQPSADTKVAILFPVYHEDPARVVAGMIAVAQSIIRHAPFAVQHYEFFLLSDSRNAGYRIAEISALEQARYRIKNIKFHYRWRKRNTHAKLGNITEFCRRWGKLYNYMLVMDADSIMNGDTIHKLLCMMEGNHRLGILQTNPTPILRKSLFGRMQQFAGRLYGSAFSYSLQAMYMGHASYIGHNALIRTQAFIEHCMLPDLPGKTPWGGKPLSHDIIEAALMARAGYEVWFLPDMNGSYEEIPANLLGFLIRERRWMQGNLQHARFFFIEGLHSIHRENFINGFMGYLSAPLWAMFLIISAWSMISYLKNKFLIHNIISQIEIPSIMLLAASIVFLFSPRIIAIIINFHSTRSIKYGGKVKLLFSTLAETLFSFFFAPLMMAFISKFIWLWAKRRSISWGTQQRDDEPLAWKECFQYFGWVSAVGIFFSSILIYNIHSIYKNSLFLYIKLLKLYLNPTSIFIWFAPILGGLILGVLIARITSLTFPQLQRKQWFLIPEEFEIPSEIKDTLFQEKKLRHRIPTPGNLKDCLIYAVRNPFFYVKQRARAKINQNTYIFIKKKLDNNEKLSIDEFMNAIYEKRCLDRIHKDFNLPF
ncbi:glucans biosynthesis glucosyltransferase MdoH [Zymomonas mobilis]|uniref:glucans biosynthesis glucosyltransferase MdoH n=1 Tax=Zymomonas mobilis TaxID=542 RepID=UPI0039ED2CB2